MVDCRCGENSQPAPVGIWEHRAMAVVRASEDGAEVWRAAGDYLLAEPARHSVFIQLVCEGKGRFWWAEDPGGAVVGFAVQSPVGFSAGVSRCAPEVVDALCDAIAADVPDLPGVIAEAEVASWFAGRWAERWSVPTRPSECQRLYVLDRLIAPAEQAAPAAPGRLRPAAPSDRDTLVRWAHGFAHEVDFIPEDPAAVVDRQLPRGRLHLWDDGGPVAMASATPPRAGVSRIGFVYTPPDRRRRGYATALVSALTEQLLATGAERCALYAQLHNPTSNAIYRRMGYQPMADILMFRFGRDT